MVAQQSLSVSDTVRFTLGTTPMRGVIIDDRGPIASQGLRIYRIRVPNAPYDDQVFEMPEDELSPDSHRDLPITTDAIVNYLQHGGLLRILRSNLSGGRSQPRVWLSRDTLGNVVHTFLEGPGHIGGATVPFYALHNDRILTPKLDEVTEFLKTFGLSQEDAKRVTKTVGTAP